MAISHNASQYQLPIATQIRSGQTIRTVNLRDLHTALGVGRDFSTWAKERIAKYAFVEGQDYIRLSGTGFSQQFDSPNPGNQGRGGDQRSIEYHVSIDMAKELAMVENTVQGREVRRYFIEAERRLRESEAREFRMPYFLRRMVANMNNVPPGHFSILNELAAMLVGPLEAMGYTLPEHLWPDISAGKMFCGWLRKERGIDTTTLPTYVHEFDNGMRQPVRAKAYPNSLLADVRHHFYTEWLPKKAAEYFKERDPNALAYLPFLLPPPSPSTH